MYNEGTSNPTSLARSQNSHRKTTLSPYPSFARKDQTQLIHHLRSLGLHRRNIRARPSFFIRSLVLIDARPLLLVSRLINLIGRELRSLLILNLFREKQVQEQVDERNDSESSLQDKNDGVAVSC